MPTSSKVMSDEIDDDGPFQDLFEIVTCFFRAGPGPAHARLKAARWNSHYTSPKTKDPHHHSIPHLSSSQLFAILDAPERREDLNAPIPGDQDLYRGGSWGDWIELRACISAMPTRRPKRKDASIVCRGASLMPERTSQTRRPASWQKDESRGVSK